jgi:hypothetical protein
MAMWSERYPATRTRQRMFPVLMLIATTSAKLGRET